MNHFEYIIEVPISEEVEKTTNDIYAMIKDGRCPFTLCKVVDEEDGGQKKRQYVITSVVNIHHIIHSIFYKLQVKLECYYKTRVAF